ncbi:MAG: PAS domain S-box protein [Mariprofundaceae bacterium]|nr:PAS domain S-box protein [Mariprofundaceae bacterium]
MNERQSPDNEFRHIFDAAPVSLWVEDLSDVKKIIDQLRASGVDNLRAHFESHPQVVSACAKAVKVIQVNKATLDMYRADSEKHLFEGIDKTFTEESYEVFREELIALADGKSSVASEAVTKTLTGEPVHILIRISIMPGHEDTWSRLLVSMNDISKRKQSEEKFRDMAVKSLVGIYIIQNNIFKYVNPMLAKIFGYSEDEMINHFGPKHLTLEEDWPLVSENIRKRIESKEESIHYTFRGITRDKSIIEVEAFGSFTRHQGKPAIIGTLLDITERKQAENALRSSEKKYRTLIENSNDAIFIADADTGTIVETNHRAEELVGLPHEKLIGMHQSMLHPPEDAKAYRERFRARVVSGEAVNDNIIIQHSDGHKIPVNVSACRIETEGRVLIQGVFRDITERQRAEEALKKNESRLLEAERIAHIGFIEVDLETEQIYMSDETCRMYGIEKGKVETMLELVSHVHPDDLELVQKRLDLVMRGEQVYDIEHRIVRPDGSIMWTHSQAELIRDANGKPIKIIGTLHDITERKRAKEQLRRVNRTLRMISDCNQALVRVSDEQRLLETICTLIVNEGGYRMVWVGEAEHNDERRVVPISQAGFGDSYLKSAHISWADDKFGRGPSGRAIREKKTIVCQNILQDPTFQPWRDQAVRHGYASCAAFPLMIDGNVMGVLNIYASEPEAFHADEINLLEELASDVAFGVEVLRHRKEKEVLEEQFRQAQKMEAIGTLAGGIAHDFNNMLAGMLGTVYLVREKLQDHPEEQEKLKRVEQVGFRAAEMISQLLTFARKGMTDMQPVALTPFLKETFKLARSSVPENISFTLDVPDIECTVKGDATLLQQVLLNLVSNARHAVAGQVRPEICVSLNVLEADEALWERYPDIPHKPYARLTVEDNGYGIPEKYFSKLFNPFFTTKEVGEGTGLGLAMVYGAVQSHNGIIEVESEEGKGSVFHVFLPLIKQDEAPSQAAEDQMLEGHGETILLADDEKLVCEVSLGLLEAMGYRVLIATDGEEAVRLFREHQSEVRLAILDVVMPQMGGVDAALQIRVSAPDLPILFQTAYGEEQALKEMRDMKFCRVVTKPTAIPKLSCILRELLDGKGEG